MTFSHCVPVTSMRILGLLHKKAVIYALYSSGFAMAAVQDSSCKILNRSKLWKCHREYSVNLSVEAHEILKRGPPWSIMFFGTDHFSLESLMELHNQKHKGLVRDLSVVTPDVKRGVSVVERYCKEKLLPIAAWPVEVPGNKFDIGIVASFGHLIPASVIHSFPLGIINVHASLLPRWRGAAPIIHAILNGDEVTGVTLMNIHPHKFDIGEIISTAKVAIPWDMKSRELTGVLAKLGAEMLRDALSNLEDRLTLSQEQQTTGVTKAPKVTKALSRISWLSQSCLKIQTMFRALDDVVPVWTTWQDREVKLRDMVLKKYIVSQCSSNPHVSLPLSESGPGVSHASVVSNTSQEQFPGETSQIPGTFQCDRNSTVIKIQCSDGWVEFRRINLKGYKPMNAKDFYNGFVSRTLVHERIFN